ncbi:olfactory receptor 11H6-like [Pelodiscus sinensis]|uniref:olfactory receptor 11H6-like n=1 Tax=Pelodiscus sinensis TaxID=13735 RepID=UPI003F6C1725
MVSLALDEFKGPPKNLANITTPGTKFILLGFTTLDRQSRALTSVFLSSAYAGTLAGNLCIVWAVLRDPRLQRLPMYILLGNFSWLEVCYITTTVPRMLCDLLSPGLPISFHACFVQVYFFISMGAIECLLLAAMAWDRYLAICHPLRYPVLMSLRRCWVLASSCWLTGFLCLITPIVLISRLSFCSPYTLDHIVCDPGPLLAASCTPDPRTEQVCSATSSLLIFTTFLLTLTSYGRILKAVMRLPTWPERRKAFSTCSSHLVVVGLFYGAGAANYVIPAAAASGKAVTLVYVVGTPLLNPLIYSLRNKEMKAALRRILMGEKQGVRL